MFAVGLIGPATPLAAQLLGGLISVISCVIVRSTRPIRRIVLNLAPTTVASQSDVDALLTHAERAGATVNGPPHNRPWGIYSRYFSDPDGHLWEIIWSPEVETGT
jgi:predicted lactoylglutathione lyase